MLSSIRWKILLTFLIIIGASFAMMAALLTGLVSSTLYAQRTRQDSLSVERLAASAAPFFASARMEELHETLSTAASELGGRLIVVSPDGKVQLDTFALLEGTKLTLPEVVTALTGEVSHAYGIYPAQSSGEYAALCAARMTSGNETIGALLLSTPVTELRNAIVTVEQQLLTVFIAVAAAAMIAALVFALTLTRPVKALTSAIRRMGRGDLSARVKVRASGEMKELADSYNAMAEKIENFDRSRSQFVSNASHELKTPLATMKILLENLIYQPEMPKDLQVEFMQDMNHEIDRLTGIINDLLTLTQMDSQSTALTEEEVDLSGLTEETLHTLRAAAARAGQQISDRIEPDVTLTGDRSKLGQIIYNLIDNAIKYTPEGGEIRVTLASEGRNAVLTVTDNGIGIPEDDQAHIFDRFYRVDKARSRATGGTGLGLSIVRQMVQLHGGEITVASAPEKGSVFTVTLPTRREGA
ncbi:MAG: HAMP domain-containing protein [Clostridia bacterium]|nr:HAMP domain-containing protein [Clostridia bacterium]